LIQFHYNKDSYLYLKKLLPWKAIAFLFLGQFKAANLFLWLSPWVSFQVFGDKASYLFFYFI